MKADYLKGKFYRYLERHTPPAFLKSDQARVDEMDALLRAVLRIAPDRNFQEWWPRFEDNLDRSLKTRAWPTVFEINKAAPKIEQKSEGGNREGLTPQEAELLETKILPTARRWVLEIPDLADYGRQTLEYWGEPIPQLAEGQV